VAGADGAVSQAVAVTLPWPTTRRFSDSRELHDLRARVGRTSARGGVSVKTGSFAWCSGRRARTVASVSNSLDAPAECVPEEVEIAVVWEARGGGLSGSVIVRNTGHGACRITSKPSVVPLSIDGSPLNIETIISLEFRNPNYVVIEPGEEAHASIGWSSRPPGQVLGDQAIVRWGAPIRCTQITVQEPWQPTSISESPRMWTSWFTRSRKGDVSRRSL
jgi:hypothetical protein